MTKRTSYDFTNHLLIIKKDEHTKIHSLVVKPDSPTFAVHFINTQNVLLATGDFGRWSFCREFHPCSEGAVSDSYWIEKLRMFSTQNPFLLDKKATLEMIEKQKEEFPEQKGFLEECEFFAQDLCEDDENSTAYYRYWLSQNFPYEELEDQPIIEKVNERLRIVFDAFDEICSRMKKEEAND